MQDGGESIIWGERDSSGGSGDGFGGEPVGEEEDGQEKEALEEKEKVEEYRLLHPTEPDRNTS